MMFVLALSRRLLFMDARMRAGYWARDDASPMKALYTQTLGVVGFGAIGQEVARRAAGFGITVIVHDPFIDTKRVQKLGVEPVELNELFSRADYVTLNLPLVAETRHLIGERQLRSMKKSAFLINTSRGPLVDETALIAALDEGTIAGVGLDVYETEPLLGESPLTRHPNVLLTPHIGGYSDEGGEILRRTVARNVAAVLDGLKISASDIARNSRKESCEG
jgi:phosphoglycerate dehydrogenase-like enzyme